MHLISGIVWCSAVLVCATPGFAATEATPTPFPQQPTPMPSPSPSPELRAVDALPPEMLREPHRRPPEFSKPVIAPTLGLSVGIRSVKNHPELAGSSFDAWLGVRMHPFSAT